MYVPLPLSLTALIFSPGSLEEIVTFSPGTPPVALVTITVAVVVEMPLATIDGGWSARLMAVAREVWTRVAGAEVRLAVVSVAVIVARPTVVELVIVAVYVPLPLSLTALIFSPRSLEEIVTCSPGTPVPVESVIATVTVLVEVPLATIEVGLSARAMAAAARRVWLRVAVADNGPRVAEASVAVIVAGPGVVELVIVAVYVPLPLSVAGTGLIVSPGSLEEIVTVSPGTGAPVASVIVTVAVLVEVPSATIEVGLSARVMEGAAAALESPASPHQLKQVASSATPIKH